MRVIISGGSGLIGRALTDNFIADGHEVEIISRKPGKLKNLPEGVKALGWNKNELANHIDGADAVINLVGASIAGGSPLNMRWTPKRTKQIMESRVNGGKLITEAIQSVENKPKVLIQQSAVGFYGPSADEVIDESCPHGNDFLAEVSRAWEESTKSVESLGVRRAITRTGLVFSPRGGIFPLFKLPFSLFIGGRVGHGRQYFSWIHIADLVNAYRFLINNEGSQRVYNMCSPDPVSNADFAKTLGQAMRRPSLVPVPSFAMKFALGEASTLALDGQRVIPKRLLADGYNFEYKTLVAALSSLL